MNYIPKGREEIELLKFIAKYQYLKVKDEKYFFSSSKYYRERVRRLIDCNYLNKDKLILSLDKLGFEYVKSYNYEYNYQSRNKKYIERLLRISSIGAFYHNCNQVQFIPSFSMKDKKTYTTSSRKFIGLLSINGIEHLVYYIPEIKNDEYMNSIIYDIEKENQYGNIIIFTDKKNKLKQRDFVFGLNQVLIVEDSEENREKLKYLHNVRWNNIMQKLYKQNIVISEYNFCDYTDHKNKYISTFNFYDTEKINRIKLFLRENKYKNADVICDKSIVESIKRELPDVNYYVVNLEEFTDKERKIYD